MPSTHRSSIGKQLVAAGVVTDEQIEEALKIQQDNKEKLGTILVSLGYCTEEDIARALAQKTGFEFISLNNLGIDSEAVNRIPVEIALKHRAIAVAINDNQLYVAMQDPNDVVAIDDLHLITGMEIRPIVVSDNEIESALNNLLNLSGVVEEEEEAPKEEIIGPTESAEPPAVQLVNQLLSSALRAGASDVHIEPQERSLRIRFRIDGVLYEMMTLSMKMHPALSSRLKVMGNMDISEKRVPQDGRATIRTDDKTVDIRIASLPTSYGESITLRLLPRGNKLFTMQELGFPDSAQRNADELLHLPYGFILVTGPTGSGKSTTLYTMLSMLNTNEKNIITLEDPMERRLAGISQIQINDKAGLTFASGLRSILRNDPDIIMVGEIRDTETAKIAVESALTGHLVLSTIHTNDAAGTVVRLTEMQVESFLISSSLAGVVAQRLLRILCPRCKEEIKVSKAQLLRAVPDFPIQEDEEEVILQKAVGCIHCNHTGYKGRIGIYELLRVSEAIRQHILKNSNADEIKQTAIEEGMITMRQDGLLKARNGITSIEEVLRVVL